MAPKVSESCPWTDPHRQSSTPWKMQLAFASLPFRCFPKISSKLCALNPESNLFRPRYEGRHESFAGGERKVGGFIHRQWPRKEGTRPSYGKIAGRASERSRIEIGRASCRERDK